MESSAYPQTVLVTGGAGFIGSNFVQSWLAETSGIVVNLDKLTYAGNLANLQSLKDDSWHIFIKGDISDRELVHKLLLQHQPQAIVNFLYRRRYSQSAQRIR